MAFKNNGIKDGRKIMSYQPIEKQIPRYFNGEKVQGKRDCKEFKPYFFKRRYCKLSNKCTKKGYHCDLPYDTPFEALLDDWKCEGLLLDRICTGIEIEKWKKIIL